MTDTTDQQAVTVAQEIPEGMKPWSGGEEAPTDYAVGKAVLGRDGNLYGQHPQAYLDWRHGRPGAIDIIAYTADRLASVSSASAEGRSDVRLALAHVAGLPGSYAKHMKPDDRWSIDQIEQAFTLLALSPSPEPVPATNRAGEVAELNQARRRLRFIAERYGPGTSLSIRDTNHLLALLDHVDSLATQPATSQEGEGFSREWCLNMAALEGDAEIGAGSLDHPLRTTATPTPPTLSEDLREALKPFLHAAEPVIHNDRDRWNPCEWNKRCNRLNVGQWRALHAALAQVKAS